ncbi:carbon storage regulator CsrA [Prochlorococcus marinus XMU1419]|uniref:carbon storage regulator CsrA n=1 Tax=Prochlorococcus marinus TaxID=1219 RepID=UPI001ADB9787|nr:carbon storage regulator CsrA [Prochlorococcus marinus]MBO8234405.1 carbon storage regulator CsrA [Prochlorococcus marinus XMU1419]MBW3076084.1 carbon storage regulator CsrA [Prochlorococcus marinus str. XMU1419]
MLNKLLFPFFLLFSSFITIYPSKNENTLLFDYCYSFEKIVSKNLIEKSKNVSTKFKNFAKDITLLGANKTRGDLANKIINQYKNSKRVFIITFIPNQFYCLAGYWVESINPGTFSSILYQKSKQKINKYNDVRKEVDEFIEDMDSNYKSIKKEINNLF